MSGLTFSHAVGYRGLCQLRGTTLLCTGGNINLTQDPIMGSGVWGAGYANAAPIAYAWNYLNLQGSANFELTMDSSFGVWKALKEAAFTSRTTASNIILQPDGKYGFNGNGWLSSLSFDASEGAAVTGAFNFKGDPSGGGISTFGGSNSVENTGSMGNGNASGFAGDKLVPYWKTSVIAASSSESGSGSGSVLKDVISWSCSYNSDIQMLKCCNGESSAPLRADYILLGEMSADGNYTIFRIAGDFEPSSYHKEKESLTFKVATKQIKIPKAIVNSGSTSMATGASYVSAEFSFTALGDGSSSIMTMS